MGQYAYDRLRLLANTASKAPGKLEMDLLYRDMQDEIDYLTSVPPHKRVKLQFRNRHKGAEWKSMSA
jgi:hypothetical protein